MKMKWLTLLCSTLLAMPLLQAKHYKLFVLTGQSNSLGTTNGGEADPTSGSDPADQHVIFSWHNVVSASQSIGISGQTLATPTTTADFTTLQDQQGGVYAGSATHWGGEIEFARSLYRAGVRDFGVIKASRGGGGNTNWHKASGGHMYQHVLDTVGEAVASLDPSDTYEIVGLMYLQGESDSSSEAADAGTRLKELTDNLRADLANAANLHTVAAGTTAAGNAADVTSRANQAAIAASTSYIDYFDNTDLQSSGLSPDGLHLNKEAKTIVGRRWAQAFLNAGVVDRNYGNLAFIGDSITQGGNGDHPSYRYQVFKNLANANVPINASAGYKFVGSVNGGYQNSSMTTPDVNGQTFENNHDGHFGWRTFWINGRVALPGGRYNTNNLGNGTLLNWTGQSATYATGNAGTLTYTGTTYTPDTAVIMIGINDIADGNSATQVRDDIGTMVDQLQAANANVNIFISQTLYTNQSHNATVDTLNGLLPALAASKSTSTSSVWVIDTNAGFDPVTQTYDNVHPNASGEEYVGNRISGGLGIIEMPQATFVGTPAAIAERDSEQLGCTHFEGSDIYNSGSFASGWSTDGTLTPTPTGTSDLQLVHPSTNGRTLNGTSTGWSDINDKAWTFETRIKFNDITNGFALWLGTGTNGVALIEVHPTLTKDNDNNFSVAHANNDGAYHTFRVEHDPVNSVYYVWRDDVLLTPTGVAFDANVAATEARLLMGDYTGGSFGDNFDVTIDYVKYCVGFKGNQIYDGSAYINSWTSVGGVTPSVVNTDELKLVNSSSGGSWIDGQNTGWSATAADDWTLEMRAKFDANPNGFAIYLELGGGKAITVQIYGDRTQNIGTDSFNVSHNNLDGAYHTFRITHDSGAEAYHVFRDGVRLTDADGVAYDGSSSNTRMIFGDTTGGSFGNGFDVTIDYIKVDTNGVWIPVGTDIDGDGMTDLWEDQNFNDIQSASPTDDADNDGKNNLDEFSSDTDPNDKVSFFSIEEFIDLGANVRSVKVANSSSARVYTLQASTDLGITDTWADVAGQGPSAGNGGDLTFTPNSTESKVFYRVIVAQP